MKKFNFDRLTDVVNLAGICALFVWCGVVAVQLIQAGF